MCTVTFIPLPSGEYIFTTNRDEAPHRSPEHLERVVLNGQTVLFPRDQTAGGTWVAISETGQLVCLLNGAFEKHKHRPPYRRSRGLMVLDFFYLAGVAPFCRQYQFEGMEPFTFLIIEAGTLWEIRWDEKTLTQRRLDFTRPYIWASAPLYDEQAQKNRIIWLDDFLKEYPSPGPEEVLNFHRFTGDGDPYNDLVMNRENRVRTVSITQIHATDKKMDMRYVDLIRSGEKTDKVMLKRSGT
ncbi:MAG: NRDE family protein [Saprospiraceae bacterium]|nr:NRDE family protein [Saprospiraceae bacterium]